MSGAVSEGREADLVFRGRWSPLPPALVWMTYGTLAVMALAGSAAVLLRKLGHDELAGRVGQLLRRALLFLRLIISFAIHPWVLGTRAVVLAPDRILVRRYWSTVTVRCQDVRRIRVSKTGEVALVYVAPVGKVIPPFAVEKPEELLAALRARCQQASVRRA
ncbi:MAG: hypothetical protein IMX02_01575 [Limnochordaceae bacterium]|nr:hypothetical protein [Limnochordaceae bacterium]